jgi:hypothetical protein
MAGLFKKIRVYFKALQQLGWGYIWPYLVYQFQLRSGILKRRTPPKPFAAYTKGVGSPNLPVFPLPNLGYLRALLKERQEDLVSEADQIANGVVRLFGSDPVALRLSLEGESLRHWTEYKGGQFECEDIKLVWEPGRFGWALTLARAYLMTEDDRYRQAFWAHTELFFDSNPANLGPHWASGQEVAIRLIAFAFAAGIFLDAKEPDKTKLDWVVGIIAAHAERIPPTLAYARAQNNNHLISEAVGLYTAAFVLPEHPAAKVWQKLGWQWLHHALQNQIAPDGTYVQHSVNYHRLMLQLALFARRVAHGKLQKFPPETCVRLTAATRWLLNLLDRDSGKMPNLGGNDGAYVLPLTEYPYHDFRPIAQAAGCAFLGEAPLPPGAGDEMALWLGGVPMSEPLETPAPDLLRLEGGHSWGYLRAVQFSYRPAHADQLHLDLWWRGHNIAQDPGVYHYNADPPWHNALDVTGMHNTITINQRSQMTKAGQFLWLDWAQAQVLDTGEDERGRLNWAVVEHDGYRKLGVVHRRTVSAEGEHWLVRDQVWPVEDADRFKQELDVRLHWLVPDWPWMLENGVLRLDSGRGDVVYEVRAPGAALTFNLVRAGESLLGQSPVEETRGWFSPTYAVKQPVLSLEVQCSIDRPLTITTLIQLPD